MRNLLMESALFTLYIPKANQREIFMIPNLNILILNTNAVLLDTRLRRVYLIMDVESLVQRYRFYIA